MFDPSSWPPGEARALVVNHPPRISRRLLGGASGVPTVRSSDFSLSLVAFPAFASGYFDQAVPSYSGGSVPDSHRLPLVSVAVRV